MARIESSFDLAADSEATIAPPQITGAKVPKASPEGSEPCATDATERVGQGRHSLTDEAREAAICRASALVEFFHAESRLYEALWRQHSDFGHKAAYDLAYSNCHKASELMSSLIRGRSAQMVAFLEKQYGLDLPACANEERSA